MVQKKSSFCKKRIVDFRTVNFIYNNGQKFITHSSSPRYHACEIGTKKYQVAHFMNTLSGLKIMRNNFFRPIIFYIEKKTKYFVLIKKPIVHGCCYLESGTNKTKKVSRGNKKH